ncbi:MAG TPA: hypothetical protein VGX03_36540 [Candidatus Binatia bacterium]|jgi:hypothetical protein|nr:hypothetical protein [Candidatus Binatia bacterium]
MNRNAVIRHVALCGVLAGVLLCPPPAVADLCTDAGLPPTTSAQFLGFGTTQGGNQYAPGTPGGICATSTSINCTYHVNNPAASGFGTLADAVSKGNRYIVFDVGGTITLPTGIFVKGAYLTIDGCSAPFPGVTLTGASLYIHGSGDSSLIGGPYDVHDIIVRNIRARKTTNDGSSSDGFRVAYSAYNIVFDHVSADYSGDGNIDITQLSYNVTVSWSIFSNPKSTHNSLLAYQPWNITMHHNIFMKSTDRNPFSGYDYNGAWPSPCYCPANTTCDSQCLSPTPNPASARTTLDLWNNLVWNWGGGRGSILWYHSQSNAIKNYYNSPGGDNPDALIVCSSSVPEAFKGDCNWKKGKNGGGNPLYYAWAYVDGNVNPDLATINAVGAGNVNTGPTVSPFPRGQSLTDSGAVTAATSDACPAARSVITQSSPGPAGAVPLDSIDQANLAAITLRGC